MPKANNEPASDQQQALDKQRVASSIPIGMHSNFSCTDDQLLVLVQLHQREYLSGADALPGHQEPATPVWMYPSEQMLFNAMKRKGWSPSEQDMKQVVAIHNGVNERAWSEVRTNLPRHSEA